MICDGSGNDAFVASADGDLVVAEDGGDPTWGRRAGARGVGGAGDDRPALKDTFGAEVPRRIADMVGAVAPGFRRDAFLAAALDGWEPLGVMDRGRHWGRALRAALPGDDAEAIEALTASLGPPRPADGPPAGMAPFLYLPHSFVIAEHGLGSFETAMRAQHALTQRFTAEFCIRPFLERHTAATLERLGGWTADPSARVRRLVSEGTRTRLPWAPRLRALAADPAPVLALLERLRDDPSEYVRRSVTNNLNDIGKDHPDLLVATARRWADGAGAQRRRLLRHALRSLVKAGDPAALEVLGFAAGSPAAARVVAVEPAAPRVGGSVRIVVEVTNTGAAPAAYVVDLRMRFARPGGRTGAKVFKLREVELAPGEAATMATRVSLAQHTTRRHHPGEHAAEVLVNGAVRARAAFEVIAEPR